MSTKAELNQAFWNEKWESRSTGWDIGYPSPAIAGFMENFFPRDAAILIPGCGNAHEAAFLLNHGFTNITLLDIAPKAVEILQHRFSGNPHIRILCGDYFQHKGRYDLQIEQTFFCAIDPEKRADYVKKAAELLTGKGRIIGLLFDTQFEKEGPPFGGDSLEYTRLFEPYFKIHKMEPCYNSIPPRTNTEVFIHLIKT